MVTYLFDSNTSDKIQKKTIAEESHHLICILLQFTKLDETSVFLFAGKVNSICTQTSEIYRVGTAITEWGPTVPDPMVGWFVQALALNATHVMTYGSQGCDPTNLASTHDNTWLLDLDRNTSTLLATSSLGGSDR